MTTDVTTLNADASTSNMTSESIKTNGVDVKPAAQSELLTLSTNGTANPTPASTSTSAEAETDKTEKSEKANDKKEETKPEPCVLVGVRQIGRQSMQPWGKMHIPIQTKVESLSCSCCCRKDVAHSLVPKCSLQYALTTVFWVMRSKK